ncbi:LysR family transcriptional regulator [Chitinimonas sp. BJB300]|uniref:LysR family transcriptional regulator n=1 Tax=Chitinimonas sp. BJB300 TaxID=1559339 RepID=UPI0018ED53CB|nr:LysR family transcriptional regulator [Chitinimonas sp. BJB300]
MIQSAPPLFKSIEEIIIIKEIDLRRVDLNLLVTLLVLLRERSVSRAAEKLYLGQPAVSAALARLRTLFDDPLLVRTAQGMVPTVKALELEAALKPALANIQSVLFEPTVFDPTKAERTFVLGMPDWIEICLMPRLFTRLQQLAPGLRIAVKTSDPFQVQAMLDQDEIALAILPSSSTFDSDTPPCYAQPLRKMGFACTYDPQQIGLALPLTLEQFLAFPHLLVTYRVANEGVVGPCPVRTGPNAPRDLYHAAFWGFARPATAFTGLGLRA